MTSLAVQMRRLGKHSAVYGLGGIVSRVIAVFLLPVYTRYLDREDLGAVGLVVALSAVLVTILRLGISSAFFRFYFDSKDAAHRLLVVRTSFWFTMASATAGLAAGVLLAEPIADLLGLDDPNLVRAGFVGIWAQMNYEQLTSLFRAEERSTAFVLASLANIASHDRRDGAPGRRLGQGRARRDRRQLRRHAHGLSRPARGAPRASSGSSSRARFCAR